MQVKQHPDILRFEAKVDKAGPVVPHMDTCCWLWRGATDARGYPRFWLHGNSVTAQRAALILSGADLGHDQQVINLCKNRQCVRPDHLAVGTLSDAHALRHRGTPRVGPGELYLIRTAVRDGDATVEVVAWGFRLSPKFVRQIVSAG